VARDEPPALLVGEVVARLAELVVDVVFVVLLRRRGERGDAAQAFGRARQVGVVELACLLDEAGRAWGIKVLRYEVKSLTPPEAILRAMQAQITAEREKRALIAASEGRRQEQINIATGEREAQILRAEGQSKAIETVFKAIHEGDADPKLLAYQYLQVLPQIAQGDASKVWIIPSEFSQALGRLGVSVGPVDGQAGEGPARRPAAG